MTMDQCPSTVHEGPKHQPSKAELMERTRSLAGTVGGSPRGLVAYRSAEELADTPEFRDFVEREFPAGASELLSTSRRGFVSLMGASLALAGVAGMPGCRRPDHKIVPYGRNVPEHIIPGKALYFATSMPLPGGGAEGLIVETHEGRPTKIEGNPLHWINQGKSSVWSQSSVLGLYDPDRLKFPTYSATKDGVRKEATWDDVAEWAVKHFAEHEKDGGAGLAFVVDKKTSPSRDAMRDRVLRRFKNATFVSWDAVEARGHADGTAIAMGAPMRETLRLSKARVIVSLDRDFLTGEAGSLVNAREFAATRIPKKTGAKVKGVDGHDHDEYAMSRLYAVESGFSTTGAQADHRLRLAPSRVVALAVELAKQVISKTGAEGAKALADAVASVAVPGGESLDKAFVEECARDLLDTANRGAAVVLAGRTMPAEVHALCVAMNAALGSLGTVVTYSPMTPEHARNSRAEMKALCEKMNGGKITTMVVIDANPVLTAPADFEFAKGFAKVANTVCMSVAATETAAASNWSLNGCHFLESWGDTQSNDGWIAPIQPMIAPLFGPQLTNAEKSADAKDRPMPQLSELELLALIGGEKRPDGYKLVKSVWRELYKRSSPGESEESFEQRWSRSLHNGVMEGMPAPVQAKNVRMDDVAKAVSAFKVAEGPKPGTLDAVFSFGHIHDGRFANVSWLQELPEAGTMVCWDNPALMSPKTAARLGLWPENPKKNRYTEDKWPKADVAEFTLGGRTIKCAVWVLPGMADDTVIFKVGYGRKVCGLVGDGVGFDVYPLISGDTGAMAQGVVAKKVNDEYWIASTQNHWSLEGRTSVVRAVDLPAFAKHADTVVSHKHELYGGAEVKLKFAERLGELSHTPPNISIYNHPYNDSASEPVAGSLFKSGPQWGMTIDLSSCTGCGVCTIACQAENNIPVVGKKETAKGREMTWIRIDRYFTGYREGDSLDMLNDPSEMLHQPIACVHCEYAPCETVCPVNATVHTPDGMNAMAYNRCIGTRYCANNCPYKVRRFNFFDYGVTKFNGNYAGKEVVESIGKVLPNDNTGVTGSAVHGRVNANLIPPRLREKLDQLSRMQKNPDVTVRSRGVMEKCSYCVQRINTARIEINTSELFPAADRNKVPDGFFQTACQQACPSNSIVFGDTLDTENEYADAEGVKRRGSRVSATRADARSYLLLGYLNTRPRTSHMLKVRNPNVSLLKRQGKHGEERVESWADPFHHGGHSDDHGHDHNGGGSHEEKKHASWYDSKRRRDDSGYRSSLTVLGVSKV